MLKIARYQQIWSYNQRQSKKIKIQPQIVKIGNIKKKIQINRSRFG